jgi:hypothetical protein
LDHSDVTPRAVVTVTRAASGDGTIGECGGLRSARARFEVPFPSLVDRLVDDEFEDERREDPANHPRGDPLPHVGPGAGVHMIGMKPTNVVPIVMNFGRSRCAAPSTIVAWRSASGPQPPSRDAFSYESRDTAA